MPKGSLRRSLSIMKDSTAGTSSAGWNFDVSPLESWSDQSLCSRCMNAGAKQDWLTCSCSESSMRIAALGHVLDLFASIVRALDWLSVKIGIGYIVAVL